MKDFYFDCAASAPVLSCAREAMEKPVANPNSAHAAGREARDRLEAARETIAQIIGAEPHEIAFTPSASAACAYAMDAMEISKCSQHEHKAVFNIAQRGSKKSEKAFAHILVNNETGEDYSDVVRMLSIKYDVFTDATAAVGHIPVDVADLGVEALAAGGHKFGAFTGIGFLYVRGGISDEYTYPGTPPVLLAEGMAAALQYRAEKMEKSYAMAKNIWDAFAWHMEQIPGGHVNARNKPNAGYILSARFDGVDNKQLLTLLDFAGVCASAGSACNADDPKPSRVLMADDLTAKEAGETIRLSWCQETTGFATVAQIIAECVGKARALNL